ncbi:hypothetical protein PAAG_12017 [Paracoccidioides lutzii Pb01]|uniref:Uncharacterized protein n=1 Tax=Paracoccidioides lutzii (strain ATCC MYA-826 / Pb01) TaxID=502779 RepID=A0A0A2V191_PARBA|nr:hypothetical protein PAAG_12017 [Paracoccidioides lutzii Pb01]KGQ01248.1 hypothetical protein PAAG_12017 [Paracoccidioides lutzii Pb01]
MSGSDERANDGISNKINGSSYNRGSIGATLSSLCSTPPPPPYQKCRRFPARLRTLGPFSQKERQNASKIHCVTTFFLGALAIIRRYERMYHHNNATLPLSPCNIPIILIFHLHPMHAPTPIQCSRYATDVLGEDLTVDHTRIRSALLQCGCGRAQAHWDCSHPREASRSRIYRQGPDSPYFLWTLRFLVSTTQSLIGWALVVALAPTNLVQKGAPLNSAALKPACHYSHLPAPNQGDPTIHSSFSGLFLVSTGAGKNKKT